MASILDELKIKCPTSEEMGKANNIAQAVAAMPEGGGGASLPVIVFRNDQTAPEGAAQWTCDSTFNDITALAQSCSVIFALILKKKSADTDFVTKSVALYLGYRDSYSGGEHVFKTFSLKDTGSSNMLTISIGNYVTYS